MTIGAAIVISTVLVLMSFSPYFRAAVAGLALSFVALIAVGLVALFGYLLIANASKEDLDTLAIGTILFLAIKSTSERVIRQRQREKLRRKWGGRDGWTG